MAYRSMDFTFTDHGRNVDMAAAAWQLDVRADPGLTDHPTLRTCVLVLSVAGLACTVDRRLCCAPARVPRQDAGRELRRLSRGEVAGHHFRRLLH